MGGGKEVKENLIKRLEKELEARKESERALRESEERLQSILDNAPALIYIKGAQGHYRLINRCYEEVFQVDRDQFIGKTDHDVFSSEVADLLQANDREVFETGRARQLEEEVDHQDGPRSYISVKFPLRDLEGKVYAVCGISSDITERKRIEKARLESEQRVRAMNEELEAFTYSVSHDLRAPLRAIDGFSEALLEDYTDKLDDEGKTYLRYLQEGVRDMNALIEGLLKLSRSNRGEMLRMPVDLSDLAETVVTNLRTSNPERQVTVNVAKDLQVDADPRLLRDVMENLLGNAWKYTAQKADARIEVGTRILEDETVYFVKDNGAGFDMKFADKLFLPFQRLHRADEFSGTGIGLATVERIIHRHGGKIWAEASVGEGTTFYFTLDPEGNRHG